MNKLFATAAIIAAFIISPMASAGVSGSVGVESDKFWRGMNMSDGLSTNLNLELDYEGWFVGVDAFTGDELNSMVYGGYAKALTDSLSIRGGVISYDMDMLGERFEEVVVGGSYKNLHLDYYMNVDETDLTYFELGYELPLITPNPLAVPHICVGCGSPVQGSIFASSLTIILISLTFAAPIFPITPDLLPSWFAAVI